MSLSVLLAHRVALGVEPEICGRLSATGTLRVLELWGTPAQAGFAHGYLLAEELVRLFDGYVLDEKITPSPAAYEALVMPAAVRQFTWTDAQRTELSEILNGARRRLGEAKVRSAKLDRPLRVEDLMVCNTLADWNECFCSTMSVWGARTVDGGTLTARNLDFPPAGGMEKLQIILAYRGATAAHPWVGVSWPGLIGVYTAMNDAGVTIAMHDARGLPTTASDGLFTPRSLALRAALEAAGPSTYLDDVRGVFEKQRVMVGNNIHVSGARHGVRPPAAVFEYDGNERDRGVTVRLPDSTTSDLLCCTNHMRSRQQPVACGRFERLGDMAAAQVKKGVKLDAARTLDLMRSVKVETTLHSVCFVPDSRTMLVRIPSINKDTVEIRVGDLLLR